MSRSTYGIGNVRAGEEDFFIAGEKTLTSVLPPLIYCHGAGGGPVGTMVMSDFSAGQRALVNQLAEHFTVAVCTLGTPDTWGSPIGRTAVGQVKTYMETNFGTSGPVTLLGISMGVSTAMSYLKANPTLVRAVAGIIPCLNIGNMYTTQPSYPPLIDAAYVAALGATWGSMTSAQKLTYEPIAYAPTLDVSVPIKLFQSPPDFVCTVANHGEAFKTARPQTMLTNIGNNGHSDASVVDATPGALRFCRYLD